MPPSTRLYSSHFSDMMSMTDGHEPAMFLFRQSPYHEQSAPTGSAHASLRSQ